MVDLHTKNANMQDVFMKVSSVLENFVDNKITSISPVEWAEKYRKLPNNVVREEFADELMSYRQTPYLIEIVNRMQSSDPVEKIAVMKGTQLGFSQGVLETAIGWSMHANPAAMAYVSATKVLAKEIMETRITPMINNSNLWEKLKGFDKNSSNGLAGGKAGMTGDRADRKDTIDGASLKILSGNNATDLSSISLKFMFIDELDRIANDIKNHGSIEQIAEARTTAFRGERKIIYISSPLEKSSSNIYRQYKLGDMRKWHVPCPHCGDHQELVWNSMKEFDRTSIKNSEKKQYGIKYETDASGKLVENSVKYICKNGCIIEESEKFEMNLKGKWIPTNPDALKNYASYHMSSIGSNLSNWEDIVQKFLQAKNDITSLKAWINNYLGEPFDEKIKHIDINEVKLKNIKNYKVGTVPNQLALKEKNGKILNLVCAVDVNGSSANTHGWLAVEIKGYCESFQSYSIAKAEVTGELTEGGSAWRALYEIINNTYFSDTFTKNIQCEQIVGKKKYLKLFTETYNSYEDALNAPISDEISNNWVILNTEIIQEEYKVAICGIDTGSRTEIVYNFVNKNSNCVAIKGMKRSKNSYFTLSKGLTNTKKLYHIDVNRYKDIIFDDLNNNELDLHGKQPLRFMNFPAEVNLTGLEDLNLERYGAMLSGGGYNERYFGTFESEIKTSKDVWEKTNTRNYNHFLDTTVYSLACFDIYIFIIVEKQNQLIRESKQGKKYDFNKQSIINNFLLDGNVLVENLLI